MTYEIILRLRLGKLVEPVQELEKSINSRLAECGYERETLTIETDVPYELKVNRELTQDEISQITSIMNDQSSGLNGRVISVRRKPGNVQQSAESAS